MHNSVEDQSSELEDLIFKCDVCESTILFIFRNWILFIDFVVLALRIDQSLYFFILTFCFIELFLKFFD